MVRRALPVAGLAEPPEAGTLARINAKLHHDLAA
jgi:hypothetical protein